MYKVRPSLPTLVEKDALHSVNCTSRTNTYSSVSRPLRNIDSTNNEQSQPQCRSCPQPLSPPEAMAGGNAEMEGDSAIERVCHEPVFLVYK